MPFETILFRIDGGIARLTLNRPDRLNSFNTQMHAEVRQALNEVHRGAAGIGPGPAHRDAGDTHVVGGSRAQNRGTVV